MKRLDAVVLEVTGYFVFACGSVLLLFASSTPVQVALSVVTMLAGVGFALGGALSGRRS